MEKKQTHIKYGFVTGLIMIAISIIIYLVGVAFKPGMQYIADIPFIAGIILNGMAYSKANDGVVTFGNVFGSNFKASTIVALVMVGGSLLTMLAFPDMKEKALEMARQEMAKNPNMTDDKIDMAMNITKKYWNVFLVAGALFGTLLYGVVFSLIGAAVTKKNVAPITADNF